MTQTKIKLFYKLSLFIFKVIFTIFNDDILIYIIDWNVYTQSKSKDEKHKSAKGNTGEKRKHWPTNSGQRELDTKVQRAMEGKKLMGRKENIDLQIPGSKSWTHKCKGHWRRLVLGVCRTWAPDTRLVCPPKAGQQKLDTKCKGLLGGWIGKILTTFLMLPRKLDEVQIFCLRHLPLRRVWLGWAELLCWSCLCSESRLWLFLRSSLSRRLAILTSCS